MDRLWATTFSHQDLNNLTVAEFESERDPGRSVDREAAISGGFLAVLHRRHTEHDAIAALLARRGYRVATCTIDTEDYEFARSSYEIMLTRKDQVSARRLRDEYLAYTAALKSIITMAFTSRSSTGDPAGNAAACQPADSVADR